MRERHQGRRHGKQGEWEERSEGQRGSEARSVHGMKWYRTLQQKRLTVIPVKFEKIPNHSASLGIMPGPGPGGITV
eukprot:352209-Hanusia_phi.AAC.5